ncbi:MAG: cytochrome P450 [Chloroflexota bacterium]
MPSVVDVPVGLPPGPGRNPWYAWAYFSRPREFYSVMRRDFGEFATVQATEAKLVCALTPETARQVLAANPDDYEAFLKGAFTGLVGAGSLWVLDGARHRLERRVLAPGFHAQRVQGYARIIQRLTLAHLDSWAPGQSLRAYDAMMDITRDVILHVVFGLEEGRTFNDGRRILTELLHVSNPWVAHFAGLQRSWFPPWSKVIRSKQELSEFLAGMMLDRRARSDERSDVLALMMAARYDDGQPIPDDEISAEILTILVSGHETTAVGLSWAVYELWRHPAELRRLRDELESLGAEPDPSELVRMPFLAAVCNETLRLHTVLTDIARIARKPMEMFGYLLPAGTGVGVGIGAIHQDPVVYPEPDQFRPERFLERSYSAYEFLPFGGGHRRCLGAILADYQLRISLATIVAHWDFEILADDCDVRHAIGTGPKFGVPVQVKRRRRGA